MFETVMEWMEKTKKTKFTEKLQGDYNKQVKVLSVLSQRITTAYIHSVLPQRIKDSILFVLQPGVKNAKGYLTLNTHYLIRYL